MKSKRVMLLALVVLVGCGDINHTPDDYTQSNRRAATSGNDEDQRLAPAVPSEDRPAQPIVPTPPRPQLSASLSPYPGLVVRGEGVLRPAGQMSIVSVSLRGGTSHSTYEGTIRRGSCAAPGSTIAALNPVSSDSTGSGAAVSYAQVPTDSLLKGSHLVTYGQGGRFETCGGISGGGVVLAPPRDSTVPPP